MSPRSTLNSCGSSSIFERRRNLPIGVMRSSPWPVMTGPRPEDPAIVLEHYSTGDLETLGVRPGLASPGSIYQFTSGDKLLTGNDPEARYVDKLLKTKLALDRVYLRRASMRSDMQIIGRTLWAIGAVAAGRRKFAPPPEMTAARRLLEQKRT